MSHSKKSREITWTLAFFAISCGIAISFVKPIAQDPAYHLFADGRKMFSIPNFWNVISNFPFLIAGIIGILFVIKNRSLDQSWLSLFIFFAGIFLTGIGSAYYHINPSNETLVWDRLPMTISFMSFFSIIIGRYISIKSGRQLLFPLLIIGLASVFYWYKTESEGHGDLRLYGLVQFLPMLLIPAIMLLYKSKYNSGYLWFVLFAYAIAKFFETFDHDVFACGGLISGHSIKHFTASLAPFIFLIELWREKTHARPQF